MDMARQVWDESRHVEIYSRLLEHLGGYIGEFPETTILWRCACAEDAAARVAGVNRGLEGLACDVFNQLVHIARRLPDPTIAQSVDYVLADEITHVRMGSKWLNKLTEGDPERRRRAIEFQESIDERFNLGGMRREGPARPGADLDRHRGPEARRLHRRGDRAAGQEHAAQSRLLARDRVTPSPADQPGRELAGHLGVEATARRVRHYRYAEERMMRIMAGWIALTPELPAKLLLGRHVWDCAQHADLGQAAARAARAGAGVRAAEPEFVRFLDALEGREAWAETIERLTGVYRVLKPHLVAVYAAHLDRANPVYEPPTRRILERCLADERRHVADGEAVLDALAQTPGERARITAWERELRDRLDASGGVTGSLA